MESAAQVARAEGGGFSVQEASVRTGEPGRADPRPETHALRALAITAISLVLSEMVAMGVVKLLDPRSFLLTTLLDAFIMIVLSSPVLYLLIFRRLVLLAVSRSRAQRALAAANAELHLANRAERRARDAAEAIRSAALAMTRPLDLETVLSALLEHLDRLLSFDRARVLLRDGISRLRTRAILRRGREWEFLPAGFPSFEAGADPILSELLERGKGTVIPDIHAHPVWGGRMKPGSDQSWIGVPLIAGGRTLGLFTLSRAEPGAFDEGHLQLAEALAAPASVAIQNAVLFEQLETEREHLQTLSRTLVDVQENERRAVARELHDEAGQTLTSLKIGLRLLEQTCSDPQLRARAAELRRVAEDAQGGLHRLASNLRPPSLEHLGLVPALGQLVESLSDSSGIRIDLEATGLEGERLEWRLETDLYRIAQEAITNALRHARASEIGVVVERHEGRLRLVVEDDGAGFDAESAESRDRLGLIGMRERAESLGGKLLVESVRGRGTTIVVEAPDGR